MKAIMLSIQPKWCELIANGKKTIEVRKTRPQIETPFKCYIYCTASDVHSCLVVGGGSAELFHCCNYKTAFVGGGVVGNGKVIGEFVCDRIEKLRYNCDGYGHEWHEWNDEYVDYANMCLSEKELEDYLGTGNGYGWNISDLKIYDTPKELGEFSQYKEGIYTKRCIKWDDDCKFYDFEDNAQFCGLCMSRKDLCPLNRPPQSWCYVEEKSNE